MPEKNRRACNWEVSTTVKRSRASFLAEIFVTNLDGKTPNGVSSVWLLYCSQVRLSSLFDLSLKTKKESKKVFSNVFFLNSAAKERFKECHFLEFYRQNAFRLLNISTVLRSNILNLFLTVPGLSPASADKETSESNILKNQLEPLAENWEAVGFS